jgi:hypothetical protein
LTDTAFTKHVRSLRPKLKRLLAMVPVSPLALPQKMPMAGVYLFSEGQRSLYVGRSNNIRGRLGRHCRPGATHRMASFAFRLARLETGNLKASYKKGDTSRVGLMNNRAFAKSFAKAKSRIGAMRVRYVEEADPVRQTLLEIYVAITLGARFNDFDNH